MARDVPNDHRDQYWADLASSAEEKTGIPRGLLTNIVTRGERSNNDQISEAGAKTPFQIIPSTRKAAIEKYGIDPYLSPENAAEVAGLLLKDSLDRNSGDVASAVAEYHGGTDRDNWGPRTRAYVNRVVSGQRQYESAPRAAPRVSSAQGQPALDDGAMAQVYEAYKSGRMSPEDKAEFESDVAAGVVTLPRGADLNAQQTAAPVAKSSAMVLPPEVTDAYQTGKMSEKERSDLEADLKAGLVQLSANPNTIPEFQDGAIVQEQPGIIQQPPEPTLGQQVTGAGETALALGTGATFGLAGGIGGTLKGMAQQLLSGEFGTQQAADAVERSAMEGAEALTRTPRTQVGQEMTQSVAEAAAPLAALTPFGAELGAIAQGARSSAPVARAAAGRVAAPIQQAASKITEAIRPAAADVQSGAAGARSGGAAAVEAGALRQAKANELPVPINLTEGQKSREFGQQRFERETAKDAELGAPIRQRFEDQNLKLQQNFDAFIDSTGAETADLRSAGQSVDKALRDRAARDKVKIRSQYAEARKAGDMSDPVDLSSVINHLNESVDEAATAPLLKTTRDLVVKLGIAKDEGGVLVPVTENTRRPNYTGAKQEAPKAKQIDLNKAETFRQAINRNTNQDAPNIRQATILKGLIDEATEGKGGPLYRRARQSYAKSKKDYENNGLVKSMLGLKRGSSDRGIALEDIVRRSVIEPSTSLDDVRNIRRLLQTEGDNGKQAWKELQGATLKHIKEEALKNVARDQQGNAIISPAQLDRAIQKLDKNGKLDFVFGKKGAEMLRTVNDVAKDVLVAPPGAVNTSNTASVLAGLMDVAISGTSGVPAPVMTSYRLLTKSIKDRKTRARVRRALGLNEKGED